MSSKPEPSLADPPTAFHTRKPLCRNIRTLFNFEPPATELEIRDASLQFVRKLSGFAVPSRLNERAFEQAVNEVAAVARQLMQTLVTNAAPRSRQAQAERARQQSAPRFGPRAQG